MDDDHVGLHLVDDLVGLIHQVAEFTEQREGELVELFIACHIQVAGRGVVERQYGAPHLDIAIREILQFLGLVEIECLILVLHVLLSDGDHVDARSVGPLVLAVHAVAELAVAGVAVEVHETGGEPAMAVCPVDLVAFLLTVEDIVDDHPDMRGGKGTGTVV